MALNVTENRMCGTKSLQNSLYKRFLSSSCWRQSLCSPAKFRKDSNIPLKCALTYLSVTIQQYNCLYRTGHSCECWGQLRAHDLPPLISNTTDNTVTGLLDYCLWGPRSLVILNIIVRSEWLLIFSHCMFEAHDKITDAQAVRTECPGRRATKKSRCPRINGQEADIRKIEIRNGFCIRYGQICIIFFYLTQMGNIHWSVVER